MFDFGESAASYVYEVSSVYSVSAGPVSRDRLCVAGERNHRWYIVGGVFEPETSSARD